MIYLYIAVGMCLCSQAFLLYAFHRLTIYQHRLWEEVQKLRERLNQ